MRLSCCTSPVQRCHPSQALAAQGGAAAARRRRRLGASSPLTIRVMATITPDTPKMKPASDSASWATSVKPARALGCTVARRAARAGSSEGRAATRALRERGRGNGRGAVCARDGGEPGNALLAAQAASHRLAHIPMHAPSERLLLQGHGGAGERGRRAGEGDCGGHGCLFRLWGRAGPKVAVQGARQRLQLNSQPSSRHVAMHPEVAHCPRCRPPAHTDA